MKLSSPADAHFELCRNVQLCKYCYISFSLSCYLIGGQMFNIFFCLHRINTYHGAGHIFEQQLCTFTGAVSAVR